MKAAAVERLTPAQQWINRGADWSHPRTKGKQLFDMDFAGQSMALEAHDNVGDDDDKMFFGRDFTRAADRSPLVDQGDEAPRPGRADRFGHFRKRANVDSRQR